MNIPSASSNFSNAVTPFAATASSEVTNPVNASPMPPIKESPNNSKAGDRDARQSSANTLPSDEEEIAGEESQDAKPEEKTKKVAGKELSEQELATLMQLKARDREVRAHEQAHEAVGGQYAGAASYEYERGPDGARYAIGGEVPIRLPKGEGDPDQKIRQADQVIRAALAPAEPSAQDRSVASRAMQIKTDAQTELRELSDARRAEAKQERTAQNDDEEAAAESETAKPRAQLRLYEAYNPAVANSVGTQLYNRV
ncbi:putative metalloprotease CJM1_0395 family protein [Halioxenophilus aromaticivorans]|uniref:SrpA-related protein n=1 Tax=Halioxenophilus aromaticivorans TaxID=1306992 RepID=A0AAV3U1P3_9ALTE